MIENEFGEIGIDDALVKHKFSDAEEIFEMNNGYVFLGFVSCACVCACNKTPLSSSNSRSNRKNLPEHA